MSKVLVPYYNVYLNGKELDAKEYANVHNIKIKYTSIGSNTCTIQFSDPDMIYIEGSMIVESTPLKIVFGVNALVSDKQITSDTKYKSALTEAQEKVFEGYVSVIDANFPEDGLPSVTLHCMDKTHIMNRKEKKRTWENCTISSVVEKIAREYGFKVKIDDTKKKLEQIQQSGETDIEFITKLAKDVEDRVFLSYLDGETLYFVERKAPSPTRDLVYRQAPYNLYSFQPRINKESKKERLQGMTVNIQTLKIEPSSVSPTTNDLGSVKVKNSSTRK